MRVLIASAWDPTSGVLSVYRLLARHLRDRGVRYSAFAFDGWRADTWWTFCDELIDGRIVTLAEVLMSGKYDVLHCVDTAYSRPYGVETWVRRARFRGPVVLMAQQAGRRELSAPVHATSYVACSSAAAALLAQDAIGPVTVIHNSYDEDVFRPARVTDPPGRPVLMWVGRSDDPQKGVELFLEALAALPQFDGLLVDAAPDQAAIAHALGQLGDRVDYARNLQPSQMADAYRRTAASGGAYLCTSRHEGFLIAAVEAMACECPVIAPRIPGLAHLADGIHAVLYDRGAGIGAIVHAVRRLDAESEKLVPSARSAAEARWGSRVMAEAYLRVYIDAAGVASRRPRRRFIDAGARAAWRFALRVRPRWIRARSLLRQHVWHGSGDGDTKPIRKR